MKEKLNSTTGEHSGSSPCSPVYGFRRAYRWTAETIPDDAAEIQPSVATMGQRIDILNFSDQEQCQRAFKHLDAHTFPCAMDITKRTIKVILPDIIKNPHFYPPNNQITPPGKE
jgi:hypothetical protein